VAETTGIKTVVQLVDQMTAPIMAIQNAIRLATERFEALEGASNIDASSLANVKSQIDLINAGASMMEQTFVDVQNNIEAATGAQKGFTRAVKDSSEATSGLAGKISGAVAAYATIQTVKKVLDLSDSMASTTARLDIMNDGLQTTEELQDKIFASAQRSRGSYANTADLVAKLGILAGDAFKTNDETIAFAEQLNKQFVISGASGENAADATRQITQALASGVLRGDELNSVFENAPTVALAIADYLGLSIGEVRELAAEGLITADIMKNALFNAADETNEKFEQMPLTWGQLWTGASNALLMALQPVLQWIGDAAAWIRDNWENIAPIFYGVAAALVVLAVGLGIVAAAHWIATGAAKAFFTTLLANPLTWIVLAIGVVVAMIYKWVQSVGGLKIAWAMVVNWLKTTWDNLKIAFKQGVNSVIFLFDGLRLAWVSAGTAIANFLGDLNVKVLTILQGMVNTAIDIINGFIGVLNKIPGVNIGLIEQVTFATTAQAENEAKKQARNDELEDFKAELQNAQDRRQSELAVMKEEAAAAREVRLAEIENMRNEAAKEKDKNDIEIPDPGEVTLNTEKIAGNTAKTADYSEEDLKYMRDIAEREAINRFTTAEIVINQENNISNDMDIDGVLDRLTEEYAERLDVSMEGAAFA
jgi:tape measure domain-containing protein